MTGKMLICYKDGTSETVEQELTKEQIERFGLNKDSEPTQLDIIEAQVTYTAMITGTLLEV